jgi:hypothetical protein
MFTRPPVAAQAIDALVGAQNSPALKSKTKRSAALLRSQALVIVAQLFGEGCANDSVRG